MPRVSLNAWAPRCNRESVWQLEWLLKTSWPPLLAPVSVRALSKLQAEMSGEERNEPLLSRLVSERSRSPRSEPCWAVLRRLQCQGRRLTPARSALRQTVTLPSSTVEVLKKRSPSGNAALGSPGLSRTSRAFTCTGLDGSPSQTDELSGTNCSAVTGPARSVSARHHRPHVPLAGDQV